MCYENTKPVNLNKWVIIALFLLCGSALFLAGVFEKQTLDAGNTMYCDMVRTGRWPDYNENYREICLTPTESGIRGK